MLTVSSAQIIASNVLLAKEIMLYVQNAPNLLNLIGLEGASCVLKIV